MLLIWTHKMQTQKEHFNEVINHELLENVWRFDFLLLYLHQEIIKITDYGKKFNVTCCYEHLFCFSVSFHNCRSHSSHSRGRILICHFCHLSDDFRHFYIKDE